MIQRRTLLAALAAPAIIQTANAQSAFDWKQAKGASIEVNLAKSPRADILIARNAEFEALTGITANVEQIPEQQQRPKVAMEMASGRPSFDVVNIATHVQKRLIEKANWMEDLRPLLANPALSAPDPVLADSNKACAHAVTSPDGKINLLPFNQDLFILYYNKEMFTQAGLQVPTTLDEMLAAARKLTDKSKGVYGFVGRGLKNANVALWDNLLLGWDQETVSEDGRKLLTSTDAAIAAGQYYQTLMRECAPPGVVGFNWNESQTSFMQGRAAMWYDGIGFSAPLVDPKVSRIVGKVGFAPVPGGPKARAAATYIDGIGIAAGTRNKTAAWLYVQWATSKSVLADWLKKGAGTPPRSSSYDDPEIVRTSMFPKDWFDTTKESLRIARSGLPEIVPVTEFRDTLGIGLTNIIGGADVATELKRATAAFQPVLDKENAA